jgi:glutathione synthase/RimK-type ligase-like ATP-grasp enzyme
MKKIGILFGQENSFPPAFVERVNQKAGGEVQAEFVRIDKVVQGEPSGYDVIVDRISQDVPFYRGFLKNAALTGTAVVNNPFWWSATRSSSITRSRRRSASRPAHGSAAVA